MSRDLAGVRWREKRRRQVERSYCHIRWLKIDAYRRYRIHWGAQIVNKRYLTTSGDTICRRKMYYGDLNFLVFISRVELIWISKTFLRATFFITPVDSCRILCGLFIGRHVWSIALILSTDSMRFQTLKYFPSAIFQRKIMDVIWYRALQTHLNFSPLFLCYIYYIEIYSTVIGNFMK